MPKIVMPWDMNPEQRAATKANAERYLEAARSEPEFRENSSDDHDGYTPPQSDSEIANKEFEEDEEDRLIRVGKERFATLDPEMQEKIRQWGDEILKRMQSPESIAGLEHLFSPSKATEPKQE